MSDEGWDTLNPAFQEPDPPKASDLDILYGRVFKSEEGQRVLAHLRAITIELPAWNPGEDSSFGYVRTGMAEIVRLIEKRVNRSNNG